MSIVPASRLSSSDLALLGNNLRPVAGGEVTVRRRRRRFVAAVNRSLSAVGERVGRLYPPPVTTSVARAG
jgi:hypothetical protein